MITFPLLEYIDLDDNQIESIEGLNKIYMPSIKLLHLSTFSMIS